MPGEKEIRSTTQCYTGALLIHSEDHLILSSDFEEQMSSEVYHFEYDTNEGQCAMSVKISSLWLCGPLREAQ